MEVPLVFHPVIQSHLTCLFEQISIVEQIHLTLSNPIKYTSRKTAHYHGFSIHFSFCEVAFHWIIIYHPSNYHLPPNFVLSAEDSSLISHEPIRSLQPSVWNSSDNRMLLAAFTEILDVLSERALDVCKQFLPELHGDFIFLFQSTFPSKIMAFYRGLFAFSNQSLGLSSNVKLNSSILLNKDGEDFSLHLSIPIVPINIDKVITTVDGRVGCVEAVLCSGVNSGLTGRACFRHFHSAEAIELKMDAIEGSDLSFFSSLWDYVFAIHKGYDQYIAKHTQWMQTHTTLISQISSALNNSLLDYNILDDRSVSCFMIQSAPMITVILEVSLPHTFPKKAPSLTLISGLYRHEDGGLVMTEDSAFRHNTEFSADEFCEALWEWLRAACRRFERKCSALPLGMLVSRQSLS